MQHVEGKCDVISIICVWLILQTNFGEADDKCGSGKRKRGEFCCVSETCNKTGFQGCLQNNTKDICIPCEQGFYTNDIYETSYFGNDVCVPIRKCLPEEIRNEDGVCECDRSRKYYLYFGSCILTSITCNEPGFELSMEGKCSTCKDGFFKKDYGNHICKKMSDLQCSPNQELYEGNITTDRKCVDKILTSTVTLPTLPSTTTSTDIDEDSNNLAVYIGISVVILIAVVVVASIIYYRRYKKQKDYSLNGQNERGDVAAIEEREPLRSVTGSVVQPNNAVEKAEDSDSTSEEEVEVNYGSALYSHKQGAERFTSLSNETSFQAETEGDILSLDEETTVKSLMQPDNGDTQTDAMNVTGSVVQPNNAVEKAEDSDSTSEEEVEVIYGSALYSHKQGAVPYTSLPNEPNFQAETEGDILSLHEETTVNSLMQPANGDIQRDAINGDDDDFTTSVKISDFSRSNQRNIPESVGTSLLEGAVGGMEESFSVRRLPLQSIQETQPPNPDQQRQDEVKLLSQQPAQDQDNINNARLVMGQHPSLPANGPNINVNHVPNGHVQYDENEDSGFGIDESNQF